MANAYIPFDYPAVSNPKATFLSSGLSQINVREDSTPTILPWGPVRRSLTAFCE